MLVHGICASNYFSRIEKSACLLASGISPSDPALDPYFDVATFV